MTVSLERIRDAVVAEYEISVEQFASYRLGVPYTEARRVYAALAWELTPKLHKEIAALANRSQPWAYTCRNYPIPRSIRLNIERRLNGNDGK